MKGKNSLQEKKGDHKKKNAGIKRMEKF